MTEHAPTPIDAADRVRRDLDALEAKGYRGIIATHTLDLRAVFDALDAAQSRQPLSTPPADDVREALGLVIEEAIAVGPVEGVSFGGRIADAVLAAPGIEVRPHGTVAEPTAEQVLAGLNAEGMASAAAPSLDFYAAENIARMRNVLRAVREIHPTAGGTFTLTVDVNTSELDDDAAWLEHGRTRLDRDYLLSLDEAVRAAFQAGRESVKR